MAPLTPIRNDYNSNSENHYEIVTSEPFLCCVIMMISSRYHTLPGPGGQFRGYMIHKHLWNRFQEMINELILGQHGTGIRTLGSIEALLLLSEWQPRGLQSPLGRSPLQSSWRQCTSRITETHDSMAWMTISIAMSLAQELGIFDHVDPRTGNSHPRGPESHHVRRCKSIASLLHTYQCQLATRLGRKSTAMPGIGDWPKLSNLKECGFEKKEEDWASFMAAWVELSVTCRSIDEILFPSAQVTNSMLVNNRYISIIDNFQCILKGTKLLRCTDRCD